MCYNIFVNENNEGSRKKGNIKMKKEQTAEVKSKVDAITGKNYTKTYASKSETLHIRLGTYPDRIKETEKEWVAKKEAERECIISELRKSFPQYTVSANNKRYQGFINDICITVK